MPEVSYSLGGISICDLPVLAWRHGCPVTLTNPFSGFFQESLCVKLSNSPNFSCPMSAENRLLKSWNLDPNRPKAPVSTSQKAQCCRDEWIQFHWDSVKKSKGAPRPYSNTVVKEENEFEIGPSVNSPDANNPGKPLNCSWPALASSRLQCTFNIIQSEQRDARWLKSHGPGCVYWRACRGSVSFSALHTDPPQLGEQKTESRQCPWTFVILFLFLFVWQKTPQVSLNDALAVCKMKRLPSCIVQKHPKPVISPRTLSMNIVSELQFLDLLRVAKTFAAGVFSRPPWCASAGPPNLKANGPSKRSHSAAKACKSDKRHSHRICNQQAMRHTTAEEHIDGHITFVQ